MAIVGRARSAPTTMPALDEYALICKPVKPHWTHATAIHRARLATRECRLVKYWTVVDGQWVAR